jgi:hypothetical protein
LLANRVYPAQYSFTKNGGKSCYDSTKYVIGALFDFKKPLAAF